MQALQPTDPGVRPGMPGSPLAAMQQMVGNLGNPSVVEATLPPGNVDPPVNPHQREDLLNAIAHSAPAPQAPTQMASPLMAPPLMAPPPPMAPMAPPPPIAQSPLVVNFANGPTPGPLAGPPTIPNAVAWGTAVLVNRDGSDGTRFPLSGEYMIVGRQGADIAFEEDRFLARQHARLENGPEGTKVLPLDGLNGVFRKVDAPVEITDNMMILVGREVLRYEKVDTEERVVHPLVRHGVALFGSPPREPWGRLVQIVPSGGYRDVRHLVGDEIVLGREEGDLVYRDDAFMSRRHAAMTWDGKRAMITDLTSSNGTFVRITGPTPLKHGDHLRMGDQLLRVELGR
jgi:pSer/pThr/pTyr-binding forkhead associated (FHA) protein